ncbi:MAG: F0F1 ATP synthase subunit gamma [Anaerolineae bacterium]|nr:F0F1 ATP synthase subunit gamma [Anaerolineae bacterium]
MAQDLERAQSRLENVRAVGPILAALRTISLGSWQMALNQLRSLQEYSARLLTVLPVLLPHIQSASTTTPRMLEILQRRLPFLHKASPSSSTTQERVIALVIGSERGLCGRYNMALVARAEQYFAEMEQRGASLELAALGSRIVRIFHRQKHPLRWSQSLPVTRLPAFEMAFQLTRDWLRQYEASAIDAVDVLYNAYDGTGRYTPTVSRLLPPDLPSANPLALDEEALTAPYIVETDPLSLYARIVEQWTAINVYTLLLTAAASEHSARFQLMESATQNVDRLVEELTLELQSARRQAITIEMQELASSAGLLGNEYQPDV